MANSVSGYMNTLVSAGFEYEQVMVGTTSWLDSVVTNAAPNARALYQTLDVVVPADVTSSVTNISAGSGSVTDLSNPYVAVTINQNYQYAFAVPDFQQATAGADILRNNLFAAITGLGQAVNAAGCAIMTSTNLSVNTQVSCSGGTISKGDLLNGITQLKKQKVVIDSQWVTLLTNSDVHSNILADDELTSARIASNQVAFSAHTAGDLQTLYGSTLRYDQGLDLLTTGSSTKTYTAALFHKFSTVLATAPPIAPVGQAVEVAYGDYKGIPYKLTIGYERALNANVCQINAIFGVKVIRPSLGVSYTVSSAGSEDTP